MIVKDLKLEYPAIVEKARELGSYEAAIEFYEKERAKGTLLAY